MINFSDTLKRVGQIKLKQSSSIETCLHYPVAVFPPKDFDSSNVCLWSNDIQARTNWLAVLAH